MYTILLNSGFQLRGTEHCIIKKIGSEYSTQSLSKKQKSMHNSKG